MDSAPPQPSQEQPTLAGGGSNVNQIFADALDLPSDQRAAFLDARCGQQTEIRREVEALLEAHEQAGSFLAGATSDAPPSISASVGGRIGRYKLLQAIGEGGFGTVFMAEQEHPIRRRVAIKIIKLGMDTRAVIARFEAERQALAMMDHPNIAKVLDAGATETGRPYFVMELVNGVPLTTYCDENRLTTRERLELFVPICQAVQHAHQKGIIHRDLKPSNVLVTLHDGRPMPKVIDFGIAKATQARLTEKTLFTEFKQMIGTPQYMSPEQAETSGLDIDTRTDVYSLGVLLYELLTGTTPLDAQDLRSAAYGEMQRMIREVDPPNPSTRLSTMQSLPTVAAQRRTEPRQLARAIRGELDWIVMKSLEKDRTRRYETATGLAADVLHYLADEPVSAGRPSHVYRAMKFARRQKLPLAVAALFFIIAIGGTFAYVRGIRIAQKHTAAALLVAEQERSKAQTESQRAQHSAASSDARYLMGQSQLPSAMARAIDAYRLGGKWEDGYLLDEIYNASRGDWSLGGQIELNKRVVAGCLVRADKHDYLVTADDSAIQLYNEHSCQGLGSIQCNGTVQLVASRPDGNIVYAVGALSVTAVELPLLTIKATKSYESPIRRVCANSREALVIHEDGTIRVVDSTTLADRGVLNWHKIEGAGRDSPDTGDISPSGRVLVRGGAWWTKPLLWDRDASGGFVEPRWLSKPERAGRDVVFLDDTHLTTVDYSPNGSVSVSLASYQIDTDAKLVAARSLRSEALKARRNAQLVETWQSNGKTWVGALSNDLGLAAAPMGDTRDYGYRYDTIWPFESEQPQLLCAKLERGLLVLQAANSLLVFNWTRGSWNNNNMAEYTSAPCDAGLIRVGWPSPESLDLTVTPYDRGGQPRSFTLQWLQKTGTDTWAPWSVASTPDGRTVVVIALRNSGEARMGDTFSETCAVVYHPGGWNIAPASWEIASQFPLNVTPPSMPWLKRFSQLSPGGEALAYWSTGSPTVRYALPEGRSSEFRTFARACRSIDGRYLAGVDGAGILWKVDIASNTATEIGRGLSSAENVCFSADASKLIVSAQSELDQFDLSAANGKPVRRPPLYTNIAALAWPANGDRFVGYRPDAPRGGSIVLADTESGKAVALLNAGGEFNSQSHFTPSGNELLLDFSRWRAEVIRAVSPEQLTADLRRPEHIWREPGTPLEPVVASTTQPQSVASTQPSDVIHEVDGAFTSDDLAKLQAGLGMKFTVEGTISVARMTTASNAVVLQFTGKPTGDVTIWVPPPAFAALKKTYGEKNSAELSGQRIQVTGRLSKYKGLLEFVVEDISQLRLLDRPVPAK